MKDTEVLTEGNEMGKEVGGSRLRKGSESPASPGRGRGWGQEGDPHELGH